MTNPIRKQRRQLILILSLSALCIVGAVKCRGGVVTDSFISRVIWKESRNNPHAVGKAGERGVGQLTKAAWKDVNAYFGWSATYEQAVTIYARQYIQGFLLMQEGRLRARYKRQPSEAEVYRSYNRGFRGATR